MPPRNRMAAAVFGDWAELPPGERNWARLVFLRPDYRSLFVDWEQKAIDIVCTFRPDQVERYHGAEPDSASAEALRLPAGWGTDATRVTSSSSP